MDALASQQEFNDYEFDDLSELLTTFSVSIAGLCLEQQRTIISTLVRKTIRDGEKALLILFVTTDSHVQ